MKEKIVCAAVYFDNKVTEYEHQPDNINSGFVISGLRHCNCFGTLLVLEKKLSIAADCKQTQGFITSENRFVDRKEGAIIARKVRQVNRKCKILFSEDLY